MRFSTLRKAAVFFATALLASAFLTVNILAQAGTSGVRGTVTDQNGAAVPGATVTLSNPDTGFNRNTTTGDDGTFNFPGIQPATYRIEVTAANFKKLVSTNVRALVDSPIELNLSLETGDVSAVVDVTSNTVESIVNTQDASLGNNFVPQQITQLPTDLRRVADLLSLQPGVTREGYVAGGRSDQANVLLDGVDINDQQNGGRTGQFQTSQDTVLRATAESVEEFRITTTNANANLGRSSGAQITLVTKSGTNDFHGSVFYFYRPTAFSANSFFNNAAGRYEAGDSAVLNGFAEVGEERAPRPSLARDVFGGSIGGPIVKDRLFFFYTYEGQRQQEGVSVVRLVPLAHLGQGQLRYCSAFDENSGECMTVSTLTRPELESIYSVVGLNQTALDVLADAAARYPANDTSLGDGYNTGGFRFNSPTTTEENTHIARFDYKITDSQSLYFRGNFQNDILTGTSQFPDTPATSLWDHPWGFVTGHDWAINNSMVNNFRYGLTRQAFSQQGDSSEPSISFRFVYSPLAFVRTLNRVTPTHNITDDFTWLKGNHTIQFGGNVRIIRNHRVDFGSAYDSAITNPSFYAASGRVLDRAVSDAGYPVPAGSRSVVQNAATAVIGRFSEYAGNFTFDIDGTPLPVGTPTDRTFATEEYDFYVQDIWKARRNLTLTLGLRYGLSRPVYEKNGFQVVPDTPLGEFFEKRKDLAAVGVPVNDLIQFVKGGPANNGPGFYSMDWKNWQPRLAFAWSPDFEDGFLGAFFGRNGESVIRGGFGITSDHFGGQLAVSFSGLSTIGFTSSTEIAANTYNLTTNIAPLFQGFNQDIRTLPGIDAPEQRFSTPADESQRIETSLDSTIKTPKHYTWNLSFGRQLPWGMYAEASYIGRKARNLLAARDVMALNNLVDPITKLDWYTAAGMLHDLRAAGTDINDIPEIPYFTNLFPNAGPSMAWFWDDSDYADMTPTQAIYYMVARDGYDILDWTFVQSALDDDYSCLWTGAEGCQPRWANSFFHPQYAAFSAFSSAAKSDYHGATFTLRQRLGETLTYDFNYTWARSFDLASGLQTGASYGSQFILNPLRPEDNYSASDFDIRHSINANFIFQLPIGQGKHWFSDINSFADAVVGGWQLSGIYRWNTGLPIFSPFDAAQWATNWNAQSSGVRVRDVQIETDRNTQNAFADPQAAYNSWRNAKPGETGDRNVLRLPGYSTLDLGLSKTFRMPWSENHKLAFRWEVINVFNYQYFDGQNGNYTRSSWGLGQDSHDPDLSQAPSDFGKVYTSIQGVPRRMQFGLRYSF